MSDKAEQELIELTQRLLDSIARADWDTYRQLCDPTLSAFEPESRGHLVDGLEFHRFYFELERADGTRQTKTTMASPQVRLMGDAAVVTYVRLGQASLEGGGHTTSAFAETRVWQKKQGTWRHVHFHRSRSE
jgi:calcium/calmodulin-dependent protein kinase (CaM kinase) II